MRYELRLYVTGETAQSQRAIHNLRAICDSELAELCQIEIVDVLENPDLAESDKILATPTLVRRVPHPVLKIIGDLSDRRKVLLSLGLAMTSNEEH